jgi:Concanavalin A-like lectin/glucanases superfamily
VHTVHFTSAVISLTLALLFAPPVCGELQVNRQAQAAYKLIAWWYGASSLSGGRLWYDLLESFPATLTNMDGASGWRSGTSPGSATHVLFDGSNDFASTQTNARLFPRDVTETFWVRRTATGAAYQGLLTADGSSRELFVKSDGFLSVAVLDSVGNNWTTDATTLPLSVGPWYHVAWTFSALKGYGVYVNCAVIANMFGAPDGHGFWPLTTSLKMGSNSGTNANFLAGAMANIKLYNRGMTQAELCEDMRQARLGEPGLIPAPSLQGLLAPGVKPGAFFPFFGR